VSIGSERRASLKDALGRYERMAEIREVEERIQGLYNDGFVRGSTHLSIGQEAVAVGVAAVTIPTDTFTCTYRGHATALALGVTPEQVLGEICGRQNGCAGGVGGSMHLSGRDVGLMPTFAIVGAGLPVAAGAALTAQTRGTTDIAVALFGDGSCNIGAFHETLNLASIWKLPIVFVIENNLYGEYTSIELTTPVTDLADRAAAYRVPAAIVDGQDCEAVLGATAQAVARARDGGGPTLLEMKTYRFSGHSRSDPASYRPAGELDEWRLRDPLLVARQQFDASGSGVTTADLDRIDARVEERVRAAIETVLASPAPELAEILSHVVEWVKRSV
jgi:TPP-dependent pyruvate/acetoin dehydrogenase alpha subunit